MRGREAIGYVVSVDGREVSLNLLDKHRGQSASHSYGVSKVSEIGSLLAVISGFDFLVLKVLSIHFAEPKEAHRQGVGTSTHDVDPLRHLRGLVIGRIQNSSENGASYVSDSLATPPLGAEVFPIAEHELALILGSSTNFMAPVTLGRSLQGNGLLRVGLQDLISRHVAVLGSSGQGKSCFTAAILQQILRFPQSRIVIFDVNGEYENALSGGGREDGDIKVTRIGATGEDGLRIPYFALGRQGLHRLLMPSEKTQRPALNFALEHINRTKAFHGRQGIGLVDDVEPTMFDDCRQEGARIAKERIRILEQGDAQRSQDWPPMHAIAALVAESHSISFRQGQYQRDAFLYGNISPVVNLINRFTEDPMFRSIIDVEGGAGVGDELDWRTESSSLVTQIFGDGNETWKAHIIDLRLVAHDLMPFVLGALLELYAYELFRRGQERKIETLLVLEEAHHYLRSPTRAQDSPAESLAYERLAKEGRKFGLALWLSTQRPSEISPTVLSQCNNWIAFRLTSERDLSTVLSASEWVDRREVKRIAGLARQRAIVFGGSIQMPTLVEAPVADPLPRSEDAAFDSWNDPLA